ncbi:error-prone DNA polymerase [Alkalilimnicola sp. S0819]|uniref:error-prone DNA polymerase n=1 Tax=Alkalilimnicola sp. S0819 TaxID=2613922 RepID=UPI001262289D|nr:error-prone DNA polymerase [Alkalilimnicola sp. S0819]KAB7627643.1 DNA polymerase III subunit alpha [Alkalilimnicola sp. S0819]MPQ15808.1 DNA polymerase III subunit alpha [Alkalilimnicola sp. S0819]
MVTIMYAELHCRSNFSFLRAASHPEELVEQAAALGYQALALTDECSYAGLVRAHKAARNSGLKLLVGTELRLPDLPTLILIAPHRRAYAQLAALISLGRSQAPKGRYRLAPEDLQQGVPDCLAIARVHADTPAAQIRWFAEHFRERGWLGLSLQHGPEDPALLAQARALAEAHRLPLLACGDVRMHHPARRPLLDALDAIHAGKTLSEMGLDLAANAEAHLRPLQTLQRLYPAALLQETLRLASRCDFSLDSLRYEYPEELVPTGSTPTRHLRALTEAGARRRYPGGVPEKVRGLIEHELALIAELRYEPYFLTVADLVDYARGRGILCQGRGSAANSAVCFCLGITEVDPARMAMLFERFISRERDEPPDIDVDFEHQRREEVIQYIYRKYGRHRAALAATVISYRPRSALRDAARALGLDTEQATVLARNVGWSRGRLSTERLPEAGFDPQSPVIRRVLGLARALLGFPRHLSQHVGGFVISRGPLAELVPTENAAMAGRSVIQWDKDDLETLGLLKVDCLALGMLSALRRALDLLARWRGRRLTLAQIPAEDPATYRMIQRADTVGVFQIESRAQMAMLPRLRPACFYDLVIEIALVRPGPIQGDMVHPYLRRREGLEPVSYPSEAVRGTLERTLGVPIFQEQVMQLAIVAAGFSAGEADRLRRAMAAWRRRGGLEPFEQRLIEGMRERGYREQFARQLYQQILGFGEYGFPESHAASFALLVYCSAWFKCHEPAIFCCALLNSQPMGFYSPGQLIRDAREHGVVIRPVDLRHSQWECTLEPDERGEPAVRLGLCLVRGLGREAAERLLRARDQRPDQPLESLLRRARLDRRALQALARAEALRGHTANRRAAGWAVLGLERPLPLDAQGLQVREDPPRLAAPEESEAILADYAATGFSLRRHPLALLRPQLRERRLRRARELRHESHRRLVRAAGLVAMRQRPGSAGGITFLTLEDESGQVNVVVKPPVAERHRAALLSARLLAVVGIWERRGPVCHLIAGRLEDLSHLLGQLDHRSRDFH